MDEPLSLAGRVALVTGAAHGIGAATAELMSSAGARVALLDLDGDGLAETARRITAGGGTCLSAQADVSDAGQVEAAVARVVDAWERLDILVNNAGIVRDARLGDVTDEDWATTLDVNLRGAMVCARAVLPHMLARGWGRILSASSVVARDGNFGQTAYAASKAGILGMTRTWARELGPKGILANAVAPGFIATAMVRSVPQKVVAALIERLPAKRMGTPEDVAWVYLFLASDLASYVNGAVIGVDGGLML